MTGKNRGYDSEETGSPGWAGCPRWGICSAVEREEIVASGVALPGQPQSPRGGTHNSTARTIQHDEHFLPLCVAHFGSLAEEDLVLVTDKDSVQDELGHRSVGEVLQGLIPADVSEELQALHIDQGLKQLAVCKHLPSRLQGAGRQRARGRHQETLCLRSPALWPRAGRAQAEKLPPDTAGPGIPAPCVKRSEPSCSSEPQCGQSEWVGGLPAGHSADGIMTHNFLGTAGYFFLGGLGKASFCPLHSP